MKCYKVKILSKDELRRQLFIYAFSIKQAKILAEAVPLDGVTTINVRETKSKLAIGFMNFYIKEHHGEEQLLNDEIDEINRRRIRFGLAPIKKEDL